MTISLDPVKFEQAIEAMRRRGIVLPEIYYSKEFQALMRSYSFSVAGLSNVAQLQNVLDSLTKAIESDQDFETWKREVADNGYTVAALPESRLDNIFRTNIQSQYNMGRAVNVVQYADTRPYLMYVGINDTRIRPTHKFWDGFVAKVTDKIWGLIYPPLKSSPYRCRCTVISLTEEQAAVRIKRDKRNQLQNPELVQSRTNTLNELKEFGTESPLTKNFDMQAGLIESASEYKNTVFEDYLKGIGLI
jgi:SPP1 gp7 family putative phage head morphogenesis protein